MLNINEVMEETAEVFRDTLDNEEIKLEAETTADDIEEWDSLTHIQLIVALEKHFKIKFTTSEITAFKNVGELVNGILKKLSNTNA